MRDFLDFILQESVLRPFILCFLWVWLMYLAYSNAKRLQRNYLRRIEECSEQIQKTKDELTEYYANDLHDIPEEIIKEGDRAVIGNDHYERVQNHWEESGKTVSDVFKKMEQDQIETLKSLIGQEVMTPNEYRLDTEELPQNCPNCGAPVFDPVCPYCDTRFTHKAKSDVNLLQVKLENTKRIEELYEEVIKAFKSYHA